MCAADCELPAVDAAAADAATDTSPAASKAAAGTVITRNRFMIHPSAFMLPLTPARSFDHQTIDVKCADQHVDAIAGLDQIALVRKHHPVLLADLQLAGLPELANVVHHGHLEQCVTRLPVQI